MRAAVYCSVVVICLAGFLFTPALEAQTNTGVIVGTVSDPTGAVIPGATVTITQSEVRAVSEVQTNAVGNYVSTLLRAGPYEIRVEAQGFQSVLRRGIVLHVNDRLQIDFTLQPGAVAEVIEVIGRATIEAVLDMSAEGVAGPKQAGKSRAEGGAVWYGRQAGQVYLSDRKVRVERPRLRRRGEGKGGELEVPAYAAMR
ncbi:MAG: carboxypeptidase regulatory-like domain-containing protein, partial [Acidobacteria bacterium]|nr:carboxypeptidase regulatory-like domain-containing protein [Acidobacteriota bacterium]